MKKILNLLIFCLSISLFSQKNLAVTYKTSIANLETNAILIASKTHSMYEEGIEFKEREMNEFEPNSFTIGGWDHMRIFQNLKEPEVLKIQMFKNEDRFSYVDKDYYISDTIPKLNWEFINHHEEIEILGYKCKEARLKFRGSEFKAYYTTEIPTTFGPWKFHGLPGLILRVSSVDNPKIYWEVEEIIYPYEEAKIADVSAMNFNLSMKEYIQNFDDLVEKRGRAFAARMGSSYQSIPKNMRRQMTRERKYEWETW
ncbi:GLPGLI family protein [Moheibacter lacus]|uniref:GLPGLI family protein n=1 Tax=Moheibacter lacus TaxID=2745851 RepID=A0A838ZSV9_9FLAO|nr:GLPGLI family protein [Moheibacter lacus]MBA5630066.1 GLPGLI family protein [Moheibacter lacus]